MKISGKIFEVTNLEKFALSFILNPAKPDAKTFKPAAGIKVHLASAISGLPVPFFPQLSMDNTASSDGSFSFNISDAQLNWLKVNKQAYFVAYRKTGTVNIGGQNISIYEPVYRSGGFDITADHSFSAVSRLYFSPYSVPNSAGITQNQVDGQIKEARKKIKDVDKLSGTILNGKVSVIANGRGAAIRFNIDTGVSTSFDLSRLIKGKVEDLDIDLPGPDFIVGMCVSKDDIEKQIEKAIAGIIKDVNKTINQTIIDQLAAKTGQSKSVVKSMMENTATVTFSKLNYPVVETKKVDVGFTKISIDIRAIVPTLSIGFPRKVF